MTNADIIRAMTDEELSKYIDTYLGVSPWCVYPADPQTNKCIAPYEQCCGCILEWLKQQHANVE